MRVISFDWRRNEKVNCLCVLNETNSVYAMNTSNRMMIKTRKTTTTRITATTTTTKMMVTTKKFNVWKLRRNLIFVRLKSIFILKFDLILKTMFVTRIGQLNTVIRHLTATIERQQRDEGDSIFQSKIEDRTRKMTRCDTQSIEFKLDLSSHLSVNWHLLEIFFKRMQDQL